MSSNQVLLSASCLALVLLGSVGVACVEDSSSGTTGLGALEGGAPSVDGGGSTAEGGPAPGPEPTPEVEGGTPPIPGGALVLPLDTYLLTKAKPLNIDQETEVVISEGLQYYTAYYEGTFNNKARKFRFTDRTHLTDAELSARGSKVWWRVIFDGQPAGYVCRSYTSVEKRITVKVIGEAGDKDQPDPLYRNQCSWTLWKHETDDTWAIRAPEGKSTDDGGMVVTKLHSTATEGYRIRVDGAWLSSTPFFTFKRE